MYTARTVKYSGFTLIEMIIGVSLFAAVVIGLYVLIDHVVENYRLFAEQSDVERKLHVLTSKVADDLGSIILINKGFCNFEVRNTADDMSVIFFTSNNDEHITKTVNLVLQKQAQGVQTLVRQELSAADSLFLQNTLGGKDNLYDTFSQYQPQQTAVLGTQVLDFKIRLAIHTSSGGVFFTPPNTDLVYKHGVLTYKTADGARASVRGNLLFIDITARALPSFCMTKFRKQEKNRRTLNEFQPDHICKSFRRIAIRGNYF